MTNREESTIDKFNELGGNEETEPLERLRFFCSLAMRNKDWLEVEPFFDDITKQLADQAATIAQLELKVGRLRDTVHQIFKTAKYAGIKVDTALAEIQDICIKSLTQPATTLAGKAASCDKAGAVAYAILASNGKVRIWWNNKESALTRCFGEDGQYDNLADGEQFVELYAKPFIKAMSEKG
jgi:hypothetical protein